MDKANRFRELQQMLAPAGGGVHVVTTGLAETRAVQRAIYNADSNDEVVPRWHAMLQRLSEARVAVLGVPSDTGAGFIRGANRAPAALRHHLLSQRTHPLFADGVIDAGDVRVVPHFLSEDMLSEAQIRNSRVALYGDADSPLPVAPLDMCVRALEHIRAINPDIIPVVIGGDHSVGWPAFASAHAHAERTAGVRVGLLHFDAHPDLMVERLGVRICYATWAYYANQLLGCDGRLVQVGIRASSREREHWESTQGVRQYWPEEIAARSTADIGDEILARFRDLGVTAVYVSNDIDGTDIEYAAATGTPEGNGLMPGFVRELTQHITGALPMIGGDLVEVAPPLAGGRPGEPGITLTTACDYLDDLISAGLRSRPAE